MTAKNVCILQGDDLDEEISESCSDCEQDDEEVEDDEDDCDENDDDEDEDDDDCSSGGDISDDESVDIAQPNPRLDALIEAAGESHCKRVHVRPAQMDSLVAERMEPARDPKPPPPP